MRGPLDAFRATIFQLAPKSLDALALLRRLRLRQLKSYRFCSWPKFIRTTSFQS